MAISNLSTVIYLLLLFSSTALAVNAVLGVDFGTEYIKASLVKPGIPLEIVLTKDTRRKETSAVAFKPLKNVKAGDFPERIYGSDAIALAARFPGDVYPNLKALLGLPADNIKVLEYSSRHPALRIESHSVRDTVTFRSGAFGPDEEPFLIEEILAMELQSIQKNAEALAGKESSVKDVVITIPPYFGLEERRAIIFAAGLAGLRVLSLMTDGQAVGLNYATTRTFPSVTDGAKPEYHLVFDMGAGSTKATVLKFQGRTVKDIGRFNKTIQEVHVMGVGWDRTLGGDALNAVIVDDMISSFVSSKSAKAAAITDDAVRAHGRAAAKLWKEAERIRQVLSANTESQAGFEGLYEDVDFRYKLNRADFEDLAIAHAERIRPAVETALSMARIGIKDLDSVILHGGAVRTPFVQKQLEVIFGKAEKIRSNVNADESAVFGAGFKGAELSPSFRVKDIKTFDVAGYPIEMKWMNEKNKDQHLQIFNPESVSGKVKTVSFQNQQDFTVAFYQVVDSFENVSPGSTEKEIMRLALTNVTVSVAELKEKGCSDGDIVTRLGIRVSPENGEVEITKASIHCEVEDDEKKDSVVDSVKGLFGFGSKKGEQEVMDSGPGKASGPEDNIAAKSSEPASASMASSVQDNEKPAKRLIEIPIKFRTERLGYAELEANDISRIKERLAAFDNSDRLRRLREESLNLLEGFTYRARDMINDEFFIGTSTDAERAALEDKANAAGEWLYGDGADASREELKAKLKEMKDIVEPIENRQREASQRPAQIDSIKQALNQTLYFIESLKVQIKAAEDLSSSIASELTAKITEATTVSNEFEGLEDEEKTTSTAASDTPTSTPTMPQYTTEDLTEVLTAYEAINTWFKAKSAEQEALPQDADPVLLVADLKAKSQELTTASMNVIMKAMNVPDEERGQWGRGKGGKGKKNSSSSKSKKAKSTKSKSSKGKEATDIESEALKGSKKTFIPVGDDGTLSEEDIAAAIEEQYGSQGGEKSKGQNEHDEL